MEKLGFRMESKFMSAMTSLYKDVKCSVRVNNCMSSWFNVNTGLKQGCKLSPGLFNLYVNDLACKIKSLEKGVNVRGENISILMYADDMVLLAEKEKDLQIMLDELSHWCDTWGMDVNEEKTKVMHFRKSGVSCTKFDFKCGIKQIGICTNYKYLGLIIDEFLDFNVTAKFVSQAAHRALGLLIAKDKVHNKGVSVTIFLQNCMM